MLPEVTHVRAGTDYRLEIGFSDGKEGVYDCCPLLDFGVLRGLRDPAYFQQVRVANGTVAWPHEQNICPDTLYLDSEQALVSVQE
jgi:hypothetical protein